MSIDRPTEGTRRGLVGRVLGVAHNPGYPLYVLLTHAFSYLPIGSLAYRINLFSALLGALTVGLAFLIARRLGCRRIIAAARLHFARFVVRETGDVAFGSLAGQKPLIDATRVDAELHPELAQDVATSGRRRCLSCAGRPP